MTTAELVSAIKALAKALNAKEIDRDPQHAVTIITNLATVADILRSRVTSALAPKRRTSP
jgi:hypothetical protein